MTGTHKYHVFISALVVVVSGATFALSFSQDNSEAYLFPSIVAFSMLCLSLLSLAREALNLIADDFIPFPLVSQIPAVVIMVAGVISIESVGMYESTFLVLLLISFWYSPIERFRNRFLHSLLFAVGFSALMYLLFSIVLNVQFSRGLLI
ncbi:MAG TPA: hypothetical protein ENI62_03155 [Gammaproteobacteria bacterium]|nr:hypothetical protein [Gammaproteobacteria bacterium]